MFFCLGHVNDINKQDCSDPSLPQILVGQTRGVSVHLNNIRDEVLDLSEDHLFIRKWLSEVSKYTA
jgi:hypothetical protein